MSNMTLAIPEDLREIMRKHQEVKWSHIAREAMWQHAKRLQDLEEMDKILSKSKLTEKDVEEIGRKVKAGIARRHEQFYRQSSSTRTASSAHSSRTERADES